MTLEDIAASLETLAAELRAMKAPEQPWLVEVVVQRERPPGGLHAQPPEMQPILLRAGSH